MRVIAGKYRSRMLKAADNFRPTTDRVRETLFNILQNEIPGSIFVDAFAGSGSVGIEALSRGAAKVYFIESNRKALKVLDQNLALVENESWRVLTMDVWKALSFLPQQAQRVNLFFFDPPYEFTEYPELLTAASQVDSDALYVVEHSSRTVWEPPDGFENSRTTVIGETQLSFYRRRLQ
jgi:16S rRNA (guanine966-N2)-methyltransferase